MRPLILMRSAAWVDATAPDMERAATERTAVSTTSELRVVVAGGGTGGHLYPGIAVARELVSRRPDMKVSFAGTSAGIESRVVPREGFPLDLLRSGGLKGKTLVDRVRAMALLPVSFVDAWRIVSRRHPHLVIGVGGYSSGPVVLAAALRGVPTMLLEQNAVPGLTNRLLAPFVRVAAVAFASTSTFFGSKAVVSGNPVRREFIDGIEGGERSHAEVRSWGARILVFGGSQGAHAINMAMVDAAPSLAASRLSLQLTHQTGERDLEAVRDAYRRAGLDANVEAFLYDMGRQLGLADVIVCRAGATTLAEITAAGKASILIPLPTATDDHQRKNAEALASTGAAEVLLQSEATGAVLADRILALASDRSRRDRLARAARGLARPDAARIIVDHALTLAERAG
jgi:UDP-N-acetylglucosamine--N-acetylmuramyl-(pentapeptide) pyrophosphoryl-undecaprenol N-acetylglucosamine transferase